MTSRKIYKQQGMTLIELLVGVSMAVFIFLTVSSILVVLLTTNTKSKGSQSIDNAKDVLQRELSISIKWGKVISISGNKISVDEDTFEVKPDGRFYKNGSPITSENLKIENLSIKNRSNSDDRLSLLITGDLKHKLLTNSGDTFNLVISQRVKTFEVEQ